GREVKRGGGGWGRGEGEGGGGGGENGNGGVGEDREVQRREGRDPAALLHPVPAGRAHRRHQLLRADGGRSGAVHVEHHEGRREARPEPSSRETGDGAAAGEGLPVFLS